jgi:hypothetical protein
MAVLAELVILPELYNSTLVAAAVALIVIKLLEQLGV